MSAAEELITGRMGVVCPICGENAWADDFQRVGLVLPTGGEAVHNALADYCLKCGFMRFHSLTWGEREIERLGTSA